MRIKSFIAAAALATATVAGVSTAATATAAPTSATTYQAAYAEDTYNYYGTYVTREACDIDGASSETGGYFWECVKVEGGWDLYVYY